MLATSRRSPAAACSGFSTGMAAMVVQLGLATIPFGMASSVWGLTSATTSGTSGSMRHAEELSMTIAPAAAKRGASSRDDGAPDGEEGQLEAGQVRGGGVLHRHLAALPREGPAGRAGRGEEPDLVDGEGPLLQERPHHATDLAGGTNHTYAHGPATLPGRSPGRPVGFRPSRS